MAFELDYLGSDLQHIGVPGCNLVHFDSFQQNTFLHILIFDNTHLSMSKEVVTCYSKI